MRKLKVEIGRVREHMWGHAPEFSKTAVAQRKHPKLTMCSIYCQIGERLYLDKVAAKLDETSLHGYMGDSVLVSSDFDHNTFCAEMARDGIYVTVKKFPQTPEEYFEFLKDQGHVFSHETLTKRQERRLAAFNWARDWLNAGERGAGGRGAMPHLEFAIAIEDRLPTAYNPFTKKTEFYSEEDGVWYPDGGQLVSKGEVLSDALDAVFRPHKWVHEQCEDGKTKVRLGHGAMAMFHTGGVLASIGEMSRPLRFNPGMVPLDSSPIAHKLVNFRGPYTLDFSIQEPTIDRDDDEELDKALGTPVSESKMQDRTMRSVPRPFAEYQHTDRLKLARVIRATMLDLNDDDVISDAVKEQLSEIIPQHPMMHHCFYEAHKDWDRAVMQARLIFEPCSDTGVRCQIATLKDCGDGSTGKGTIRELCEECLGTFNGEAQLGYSAALKQADQGQGGPQRADLQHVLGQARLGRRLQTIETTLYRCAPATEWRQQHHLRAQVRQGVHLQVPRPALLGHQRVLDAGCALRRCRCAPHYGLELRHPLRGRARRPERDAEGQRHQGGFA
jgi:hypothetical protein